MGSWGPGPFESDGALNWFNELESLEPNERSELIAETFGGAASDASYLQIDEGESIVAAAALVALQLPAGSSMTFVPRPDFLKGDDVWVEVDEELCQEAVAALDRVTAGHSELVDLWRNDEVFLATLAQIRRVLLTAMS